MCGCAFPTKRTVVRGNKIRKGKCFEGFVRNRFTKLSKHFSYFLKLTVGRVPEQSRRACRLVAQPQPLLLPFYPWLAPLDGKCCHKKWKFYCFFCHVEKNTYFCKTPKGGNLIMIITSGRHRMAVNVKAERVGLSFQGLLCPVLMPSSFFFETVKMTLYGRKLTLLQ